MCPTKLTVSSILGRIAGGQALYQTWPHRHVLHPEVVIAKLLAFAAIALLIIIGVALKTFLGKRRRWPGRGSPVRRKRR